MGTIIIGFQDDDRGNDALALGRTFAELLDARPLVIDVADWPAYLMGVEVRDRMLARQHEIVAEIAGDRMTGLEPEVRVVEAKSAAGELASIADSEHAAAIVVGSSHHGSLGRAAMGSTGTSLVHGAPCAVAVAPAGFAEAEETHLLQIGVAFDGSPEGWAALDAAIGIAERTHARLTVIAVADYPVYGLGSVWATLSAEQVIDAEQRDKQRVMDLGLGRVPATVPASGRVLTGPAGEMLVEASGEFDLLVMGSRSHGPIGRTFVGGTATRVIHAAQCAVLVLPRGAGAGEFGPAGDAGVLKERA
jgi:nucleotide-binding universal stress UspA family protein